VILRLSSLLLLSLLQCLLTESSSFGRTIVLEGRIESGVQVTQQINFSVDKRLEDFTFKLMIPASFSNKAVSQSVANFDMQCTPRPEQVEDEADRFGNRYKKVSWRNLTTDVRVTVTFDVRIKGDLHPMERTTLFPLSVVPPEEKMYLTATGYVQSTDAEIVSLARELTKSASTQYDAVTSIINFVIDTVKYTYNPPEYDAIYTLHNKSGNCTNFAHLSLALLRAAGIPARLVAGITLSKQWRIPVEDSQSLIPSMGQGKHAWIEIFYPDLGWLSYDPAQSKQFTSTRHIKESHGLDYSNIVGSWSGIPYAPQYSNSLEANFLQDDVNLKSNYADAAPARSYLFSNRLLPKSEIPAPVKLPEPTLLEPSTPKPVERKPEPSPATSVKPPPKPAASKSEPMPVKPEPKPVDVRPEPSPATSVKPPPKPAAAKGEPAPVKPEATPEPVLRKPVELGNIEFPSLVSMYRITGNTGVETLDVETAAYVTTASVYAQAFKVKSPLRLDTISLAMHKFGGDGTLYVDIVSDDKGRPSLKGTRSLPLFLDRIHKKPGYYWVDFKFPDDAGSGALATGKYWIVLRHSGEAVMTWFYTPGKSFGDPDDTRSTSKGFQWEDILNYDFVFKVRGERL
jgi:transglutaminase-like putative cysteine protease